MEADDEKYGEREKEIRGKGSEKLRNWLNLLRKRGA
jgi:hypothetical protein